MALDGQDTNCIILFPDMSYLVEPDLPEKKTITSDAPVTAR